MHKLLVSWTWSNDIYDRTQWFQPKIYEIPYNFKKKLRFPNNVNLGRFIYFERHEKGYILKMKYVNDKN
jgi:hypothetical protein